MAKRREKQAGAPKGKPRPAKSPRGPRVLTRDEVRRVDRHAIEDLGVPSIVLMENAARNAADVALTMLERIAAPRVVLYCGTGNNGGDGFAIARHLASADCDARIILVGDEHRMTDDARTNFEIASRLDIEITEFGASSARAPRALRARRPDLIIDAIFGTGLTRPVDALAGAAIAEIIAARARRTPVLAIDVPSGMDCDSGEALGVAVEADVTVTFVALKPGFLTPAGAARVGEVIIAGIGVPSEG